MSARLLLLPAFLRRAGHSARPRRSLFGLIAHGMTLHRHRRRLGQLDDRMLDDIGLNRSEAEVESGRAFWDAPDHWRR